MYESELNQRIKTTDHIPDNVLQAFGDRKSLVDARTVLFWSEHCTECAAPGCYQSCEMYRPRPRDGKCRRFVDGMVMIDHQKGLLPYVLKIKFKRWGMLKAEGNTRLYSMVEANRIERRDQQIGAVLRALPLHLLPVTRGLRSTIVLKRYEDKKKFSKRPNIDGMQPDIFLLECFNPQQYTIKATFTVRAIWGWGSIKPSYQRLLAIPPGFHREEISIDEISALVDLRSKFGVEFAPNEIEEGATIYFGIMDFVRERKLCEAKGGKESAMPFYKEGMLPAVSIGIDEWIRKKAWRQKKRLSKVLGLVKTKALRQSKNVKCIVWDMDNTIWSGTLLEDGPEALTLKPKIVSILKELDQRGILHSIASKNNYDEAYALLKKFDISDYFLCPQISWRPKSEAMRQIADRLNIGIESLLFIDDQRFEREEVQSALPNVTVVDSYDYQSLTNRADCKGSQTNDAAQRRLMYIGQLKRQEIQQQYGIDGYIDFLRTCNILLKVKPMCQENIERVHELAQRTNQLNFSGNRYTLDQLIDMLSNPNLDTFVLECQDNYGSYGTVGFCVVDQRELRMLDLALSCRIQNKRVEHAFLAYLLKSYVERIDGDFLFNYRKTKKNAPQCRVFDDMGLQFLEENDGITTLVFRRGATIHDDKIVKVVSEKLAWVS